MRRRSVRAAAESRGWARRVPGAVVRLYDHVLDVTAMVDAVPPRFRPRGRREGTALEEYFAMARGTATAAPLEMTKWFDTGIYDIHSPRVPERDEIAALIAEAQRVVPADRLWVNPDCGLKTRGYAEVEPTLRAMVEAARAAR